MGLTNYPNGISSFGMPVIPGAGAAIPATTGSVYFVDSVTGNNGNTGADPDHAVASIDTAIGKCTANKGDVIICMPNHAESISSAGAIAADIAGISIIGLGNGDDRPTLTFGTTEAADINFTADGILIRNFKFDLTGIDAVAAALDVDAAYCSIDNCEFLMADTGGQATIGVEVGASSHYFTFTRNKVLSPNAGASHAVRISGVSNNVDCSYNSMDGAFSVAGIATHDGTNEGGVACLRARIVGNEIVNTASGKDGINLGTTAAGFTGIVAENYIGLTGTAGGTLVGKSGATRMFQNFITTLASTQGELLPAADGVAT